MRIEPGEGQGCEPPTPKCVAEYDHRVATNLVLGESASKSRLDAQQWKEVRSNAGSLQPFGYAFAREIVVRRFTNKGEVFE